MLTLTGNKARAIAAAKAAGVPTLASVEPSTDVDALVESARDMPFPLFVKAVAGGGGRGMRRVDAPRRTLREAVETCMREAEGAFGDPTVFIEQAVVEPRHIEVQILADGAGNVIHLFERDCSVQRRHQKVVEIAPAPNLDPAIRERMCADAVRFATRDRLPQRRHRGVPARPRGQLRLHRDEPAHPGRAHGDRGGHRRRPGAGPDADRVRRDAAPTSGSPRTRIVLRGAALQCRITTEDPANGFRPDTGKITTYRSPGGAGVRLDGGTTYTGAEVSAHFDSMLAKLTCRGRDFASAVDRARRAVAEFRIRGVSTNIPFLQAVLDDPDFRAGRVTTAFIEDHPQLLTARSSADRGTKLLTYLADVTVNQPHGAGAGARSTRSASCPHVDLDGARPRRLPAALLALGPEGFARGAARAAAPSRSPTRRSATRTSRCSPPGCAPATCSRSPGTSPALTPQLWALEAWGGATYDVALRFLSEDPWERLAELRQAVPNICLQMLLRGRNTVGYTPYPTEVTEAFVQEAAETGIDVFRIFDALNDVEQMRPAIEAVRATGTTVAEVALCYTGDLSEPGREALHARLLPAASPSGSSTPARTCSRSRTWPGCCARRRRAPWSRRCGSGSTCRCTCTPTTPRAASSRRCSPRSTPAWTPSTPPRASMAGTTSQPALSALVATTDHTARATGLDLDAVCDLEPYWEATRRVYAPFESGLPSPTGRVYTHEIPGGQLSNLRQQAIALGLGEKFEQIEDMYAAANDILGNIVKVTPSSKVVGDLALHLVAVGADPAEFERGAREVRRPRLGHRLPLRRARRPARRLARAVPHQGAGRPHRRSRSVAELDAEQRDGPAAATARRHAQRAAVPRPDQGVRGVARRSTATSRCCPPRDYLYGLRHRRGARGRASRRASG